MSWTYDYDDTNDETVVSWRGVEQDRVDGEPSILSNGYVTDPDIRPIIKSSIKQAEGDKMSMLVDLIIFGIDKK